VPPGRSRKIINFEKKKRTGKRKTPASVRGGEVGKRGPIPVQAKGVKDSAGNNSHSGRAVETLGKNKT